MTTPHCSQDPPPGLPEGPQHPGCEGKLEFMSTQCFLVLSPPLATARHSPGRVERTRGQEVGRAIKMSRPFLSAPFPLKPLPLSPSPLSFSSPPSLLLSRRPCCSRGRGGGIWGMRRERLIIAPPPPDPPPNKMYLTVRRGDR